MVVPRRRSPDPSWIRFPYRWIHGKILYWMVLFGAMIAIILVFFETQPTTKLVEHLHSEKGRLVVETFVEESVVTSSSTSLSSSSSSCHGLEGMKVLVFLYSQTQQEVGIEHETEAEEENKWDTLALIQQLKKCLIHVTKETTNNLLFPESDPDRSKRKEKTRIDTINYDAVLLAPGIWNFCSLTKKWKYYWKDDSLSILTIDIFMGGRILHPKPNDTNHYKDDYGPHREDDDADVDDLSSPPSLCDWKDNLIFTQWNTSLVIVRDQYTFHRLSDVSWTTTPSNTNADTTPTPTTTTTTVAATKVMMIGDLMYSFEPQNTTLNYWKQVYETWEEDIIVFTSGSNVGNILHLEDSPSTIGLSTQTRGKMTVPIRRVLIVTSSRTEDRMKMREWKDRLHTTTIMAGHQFVHYQSIEQIFALISRSTHVYTDRYHPGIIAHRYGKEFTILKPLMESPYQDKLGRLLQLMSSSQSHQSSASQIREEYNVKAFEELFNVLRRLKKNRPSQELSSDRLHTTIQTPSLHGTTKKAKKNMKKKTNKSLPIKPSLTSNTNRLPYAIVVGLPKSGTTSVYHFFSCSGGYSTTHYCCCGSNETEFPCTGGRLLSEQIKENLDKKRSFWYGTMGETTTGGDGSGRNGSQQQQLLIHAQLDGESSTDTYFLPQYSHLKELHESAPDAIWILPLRPANRWKKSVKQWLDMGERLQVMYERDHPDGGEGATFDLERFYDDHTQRIRDFCQNHRRRRRPDTTTTLPLLCVEVEIENPDAGNQLVRYFQNTKASCWGKHNSGPFFQAISMPL